jgi:hypothetical protein
MTEERFRKLEQEVETLKKQSFKFPLDPTGLGALNQSFFPYNFDKFNVTNLHLKTGNSIEPSVNGQVVYNENAGTPQLQAMIDDVVVDLGATGGSGTPAGADTQIQFNDAGAFGGAAGLLWDKTTDILTFSPQTGNASNILVLPAVTSSDNEGFQFAIVGSDGDGAGDGGVLDINSGNGGTNGSGGTLTIQSGVGGATSGSGGGLSIYSGDALAEGGGGVIEILGGWGRGDSQTGGELFIEAGLGILSNTTGESIFGGSITITSGGVNVGGVSPSGNTGTPGDVNIEGGNSNGTTGWGDGTGGNINIKGGNADGNANGGYVNITLGSGDGTGHQGRLNIQTLPTSASGLATGDVWVDTTGGFNILKIV